MSVATLKEAKIFLTDEGYEEYALGRFVEIAMEG